ncbi:DUF3892 domain-containing protein [Pseudomonas cichorii]|uniref:Uncharacterized protein n=1 Tax=Pseudomonas cichorii TaxID=36746 RepID=A0ABQ1DIG5_PSECI|nr:DUF3892 domain-containing protein [Pseudomonas cichorii]QVE15669.1 DUF3892 domain-containing protein [Pseudomonas cichorii]GFM90774.1 hypothetical protein PSCICP_07460 [Pseudomonas cichorii]
MAEFLIFGVAYNKDDQHIDWVVVSRAVDRKLRGLSLVSRQFIVELIKTESATFKTATIHREINIYEEGAKVHIYDDEYLTTAADDTEKNNLESLPSFVMPDDDIEAAILKAFPGLSVAD